MKINNWKFEQLPCKIITESGAELGGGIMSTLTFCSETEFNAQDMIDYISRYKPGELVAKSYWVNKSAPIIVNELNVHFTVKAYLSEAQVEVGIRILRNQYNIFYTPAKPNTDKE